MNLAYLIYFLIILYIALGLLMQPKTFLFTGTDVPFNLNSCKKAVITVKKECTNNMVCGFFLSFRDVL